MSNPEPTVPSVLMDAFDRVTEGVDSLVTDMPATQLNARPFGTANSISWLVWHLTRVQDDHVAEIAGRRQVWDEEGWRDRFVLPHDPDDTGYGHDAEQVAATYVADWQLLAGYQGAVHEMTRDTVTSLEAGRLSEVIDDRFDPPVTVAVRLVSVIEDCFQHLGQAGYVSGLMNGR